MKRFFQLLIFILSFQMEVRVRAEQGALQQPGGCLKKLEAACALQASVGGFHLETEEQRLHAVSGSSLVRLSEKHWKFMKGALWVEKSSTATVETLYAEFAAPQGEYWLLEKDARIQVRNINAELQVKLRDGRVLEVPPGFEFWIGPINTQGKNDYGMIQPIVLKDHLVLWNSLYRKDKESFRKEALALKENWGDLVDKSARLYRAVVDREIASVQQQEKALALKKARQEAKNQEIKRLYYEKVFER